MHCWGDGFPYFGDVGEAADYIGTFCRRWGRICVTQTKEKYGTARVYCHIGYYSLHGLIYPGYAYSQFPDWLWHLDCRVITKLMSFFRFDKIMVLWQKFIYRTAYKRALKKWPHIRNEILDCADFYEFLKDL